MMSARGSKGYTKLDGSPADGVLPSGVHDMVEGGEATAVDQLVQEKLEGIYESELNQAKARFKLEVAFMESRSRMSPYLGVVCIWTNGGFAHGGGKKLNKRDEVVVCGAPIDLKFVSRDVAVCAECRQAIKPKELTGQIIAKLTSQDWAHLMTKLFVRLEGNADVRMGFMEGDLRVAAGTEQEKQLHGDNLHEVRDRRNWVIYPLKSIIKDTSAGSSFYNRIRAFLEA